MCLPSGPSTLMIVRPLLLGQVNLVVADLGAAVAFYERLGWMIDVPSAQHAVAELPNGLRVEFDTPDFVKVWDGSYRGTTGGSTVLGIQTATRAEVDDVYAELVGLGHRGRQPPYDAFWGSRYAIVEDPDGNPVGLLSPVDESRRYWPPCLPPADGR